MQNTKIWDNLFSQLNTVNTTPCRLTHLFYENLYLIIDTEIELLFNPLVPEIFFGEFCYETYGGGSYWYKNTVRKTGK